MKAIVSRSGRFKADGGPMGTPGYAGQMRVVIEGAERLFPRAALE